MNNPKYSPTFDLNNLSFYAPVATKNVAEYIAHLEAENERLKKRPYLSARLNEKNHAHSIWLEVQDLRRENERLKIDDHARRIAELDEGCRECALRERNAKLERVAEAARVVRDDWQRGIAIVESWNAQGTLAVALAELEEDA